MTSVETGGRYLQQGICVRPCLPNARSREQIGTRFKDEGEQVSDGVFEHGVPLERRAVGTESSGRNWAEIGVGLAAAFALIAIYCAGMWAVVVLVQALT